MLAFLSCTQWTSCVDWCLRNQVHSQSNSIVVNLVAARTNLTHGAQFIVEGHAACQYLRQDLNRGSSWILIQMSLFWHHHRVYTFGATFGQMPLGALLICWHTKKWPSWLQSHVLILDCNLFITLSSMQCQVLEPEWISFPSPSGELWMKKRFQTRFRRAVAGTGVSLGTQQFPLVPEQQLEAGSCSASHTCMECQQLQ